MQFFVSSKPSTTCCDSISRSVPDGSSAPQAAAAAAAAAASFCYPPACEKRLVSGARAELSAALGVYGSPYAPAHAYANYFQYGADSSAIYSTLVRTELSTKQVDTAPRSIMPVRARSITVRCLELQAVQYCSNKLEKKKSPEWCGTPSFSLLKRREKRQLLEIRSLHRMFD